MLFVVVVAVFCVLFVVFSMLSSIFLSPLKMPENVEKCSEKEKTTTQEQNWGVTEMGRKERKKEKKKEKKGGGGGGGGGGRRRINTIPAVGNGVGASSLEIRTRNCFKSPIQPVCCVWAIETKTIKLR